MIVYQDIRLDKRSGRPIAGAVVQLVDNVTLAPVAISAVSGWPVIGNSVVTDENGRFAFSPPANGTYAITTIFNGEISVIYDQQIYDVATLAGGAVLKTGAQTMQGPLTVRSGSSGYVTLSPGGGTTAGAIVLALPDNSTLGSIGSGVVGGTLDYATPTGHRFIINGAASATIDSTGITTPAGKSVKPGNGNFSLAIVSTIPTIMLDTGGDQFRFNPANNSFLFEVANTSVLTMSSQNAAFSGSGAFAGAVSSAVGLTTQVYTIGTLPSASANSGMLVIIQNGVTAPAKGAFVTTTGSNTVLALSDGSAWRYA